MENTILNNVTQSLINEWNIIKQNVSAGIRKAWKPAIRFLLHSVDVFIVAIEPLLESGQDKKIAVMTAIGVLYDSVIYPMLPLFLKPFNTAIKAFILTVIISESIDFIVNKYNKIGGGVPKTLT